MEEIKEKILKVVRNNSMSTAAGLEKAETWIQNKEKLTLSFNSPFASTLIEKESRSIEKIIREELGWDIKFYTAVKRVESEKSETVEEQVELVRNVFRGTIIKGE